MHRWLEAIISKLTGASFSFLEKKIFFNVVSLLLSSVFWSKIWQQTFGGRQCVFYLRHQECTENVHYNDTTFVNQTVVRKKKVGM